MKVGHTDADLSLECIGIFPGFWTDCCIESDTEDAENNTWLTCTNLREG